VTYHGKKKPRGGASFRSSRDQSLMRFRYLGAPQEPVDIEKVKAQMDGRKGIQLKR